MTIDEEERDMAELLRHLSTEEKVAWIDRTLEPLDRERLSGHVADCDECRRELAEVQRMVTRLRPSKRPWVLTLLAAAAVLVVFFAPGRSPGPLGDRMRNTVGLGEGVATIDVVSPSSGATVSGVPLSFEWVAPGPDAGYEITLTRENGEVVWVLALEETKVTLPDSLAPLAPGTYYWVVDALLRGGETATSGFLHFLVPP